MRILVISDTHKKIGHVIDLLQLDHKFDLVFHLGDNVSDAEDIENMFDLKVDCVMGNCDIYEPGIQNEKLVVVEGKRILLSHGHRYQVKTSLDLLKKEVDFRQLDVILYGHTHKTHVEYYKNSVIMNPGSISLPRDGAPSFGVITIDKQGKLYVNTVRIS